MLPPILEIYVVWHPEDIDGEHIARTLLEHFRGTAFSGLIGGAVDVYVRSASATDDPTDTPRPLPCTEPLPYEVPSPALTAVVLVAGVELTSSVEKHGPWHGYVEALAACRQASPDTVGIFSVCTSEGVLDGTLLAGLVGGVLDIAHGSFGTEAFEETLCRDLAQGIAQMGPEDPQRVTVFVSHTKRLSTLEETSVSSLIAVIRDEISHTKLGEFFDSARPTAERGLGTGATRCSEVWGTASCANGSVFEPSVVPAGSSNREACGYASRDPGRADGWGGAWLFPHGSRSSIPRQATRRPMAS